MARLAAAVETSCAEADTAFRRVNVEILGNADDFFHTHIWPRYQWEPAHLVWRPVWHCPPQHLRDPASALGPKHDALQAEIMVNLDPA